MWRAALLCAVVAHACVDTDGGATAGEGTDCTGFSAYPSWCGFDDDEDFSSLLMCCSCGGGMTPSDDGGCAAANASAAAADAALLLDVK